MSHCGVEMSMKKKTHVHKLMQSTVSEQMHIQVVTGLNYVITSHIMEEEGSCSMCHIPCSHLHLLFPFLDSCSSTPEACEQEMSKTRWKGSPALYVHQLEGWSILLMHAHAERISQLQN